MEKKFYWIKLKTDFFDLPTIDWLLSQKNGCEYIVLYQMLCLQTANTNGMMASKIGEMLIPFDAEKIARDTKHFDVDTVIVALELFKKLGLIYEQEENIFRIAAIDDMVGASAMDDHTKKLNAERQRRYRERQKQLGNDNGVTVTLLSNREIEKEIDIDKDIEKDIDIEKDKKKETFKDIVLSFTQNTDLINSISDYIEMRKKTKGFTTRALKLNLNELNKLANDDETKIKIVNQSIARTWKGFFPLKGEEAKPQKQYQQQYRTTGPVPDWFKNKQEEKYEKVSAEEAAKVQAEINRMLGRK